MPDIKAASVQTGWVCIMHQSKMWLAIYSHVSNGPATPWLVTSSALRCCSTLGMMSPQPDSGVGELSISHPFLLVQKRATKMGCLEKSCFHNSSLGLCLAMGRGGHCQRCPSYSQWEELLYVTLCGLLRAKSGCCEISWLNQLIHLWNSSDNQWTLPIELNMQWKLCIMLVSLWSNMLLCELETLAKVKYN